MYSNYYVLYENNRFESCYHHCTGVTRGKGSIKKRPFKWKFVYDAMPKSSSSYTCANNQPSDSIRFIFKNAVDSSFHNPSSLDIDNNIFYFFESEPELTLPKHRLSSDSLQLIIDGDSLIINESINQYSEVILYLNDLWVTYVDGGSEELKKRGNTFYQSVVVWIEDENDYLKKGKRKKIRSTFKMK